MDETVQGIPIKDWLCTTLGGKYCNDESPVPVFSTSGPTGVRAVLPPSQAPEGSVSPGQLKALQEWQRLLDAYGRGEASLLELRDFDPAPLSGIEGWSDYYNDFITKESVLDENITDEKIRAILKSNGYSDEAIDEILAARVDNDNFSGNNVLSNALCEAGYSNCSDWGVNPKKENGTECVNDDGPGTYSNGECVTTTTENTTCWETIDGTRVEGKRDADGGCVPLVDPNAPDCTVITQENAEECGTDLDNLVECTDNLVTFDDGDGNTVERPVYARSQEDCNNNTNTLFNCGGGIFANSRDECPDVGGVTDCNLEENKDKPECQDFCSDPANANAPECIDKSFQDYVDEVGEGIANTAKGIYDDFKNVITDCVGDPIECIKKIGNKILDAGIPEKCQDLEGCDTADPDKGTYCWKDCVNFSVLAGIPGLPPLPGMGEIDVGTYRDFEDFLKGIGKDIGDFTEDPAGTLEDWKDAIIKKVKEVFGDATDTKASDIIDWLKGIFGVYTATWVWGELEEEITNLIPVTTIDDDPDLFDETKCVEEDYFNENTESCLVAGYVNCDGGENSSLQETTGGIIQGTLDDCPVIQDPRCNGIGTYNEETLKCDCPPGYENDTEDESGDCGDQVDPPIDPCDEDPESELCPGSEAFCEKEENQGHELCKSDVGCKANDGITPSGAIPDLCEKCPEGQDFNDAGVCVSKGGPGGITCEDDYPAEGALTFALQEQQRWWKANCDDGTGGTDGGGGDPLECSEITDENADRCGKKKCPDGTFVDKEAACGSTNPCDDPVYASENEDECGTSGGGFVVDCNEPRPIGTVTFELVEQQRAWDLKCGGGTEVCDNGATVESGCETCEDGTPVDSYEDGKCPPPVKPPVTPVDPPDTTSGGGGGGGGFTAEAPEISMGIEGDPALLAGRQFPITDYLAGLFTGTGGGRA